MNRRKIFNGWRRLGAMCLAALLGTSTLSGDPPSWWASRGVIDPNKAADDLAAANIGQLKQVAVKAYAELQANLSIGPGDQLTALINNWNTPVSQLPPGSPPRDDHAAVTLGQLKAVAKLFYDQLILAHYTTQYPWADGTPDDNAIANLGQIKYLFSFDLTYSSTGIGIPDWWLIAAGIAPGDSSIGSTLVANPTLLVNGNPMNYLQAYQAGVDPTTAAASDPANPPTPPANATETLSTTIYAAIDVSSSATQLDVSYVALDDNMNVGFLADEGNLYGQTLQTFTYSSGTARLVYDLTVTPTGTPYSSGSGQNVSYVGYRSWPSVNSLGNACYNVVYYPEDPVLSDTIFARAYVNSTAYSPGGLNDYEGGINFGLGNLNMGNSGAVMGWSGNYDVMITDSGPQWWAPAGVYSGGLSQPMNGFIPSLWSPGGSVAIGTTSSGGHAVGDFGTNTVLTDIDPKAVSDNGIVLGNDPASQNSHDSLCVHNNGTTTHLSALLKNSSQNVSGTIRFPGVVFGSDAWVNKNGDIVATAECLDPTNDQGNDTWTKRTVLWQNALGLQQAPSVISFVTFPSSVRGRGQFNANADFAAAVDPPNATPSGNSRNAAGLLVPVDIVPDDGQAGLTGGTVPSNKKKGGQKHYVSPKQADSLVILKASIGGANFSDGFEWDTVNPDGTVSGAGQPVAGSSGKWSVKRDTPGQYIVRIKRKTDHVELVRMNVWVVWANGVITHTPTVGGLDSGLSHSVSIDGKDLPGCAIETTQPPYIFKFTIQPSQITDKNKDIPKLDGNSDRAGDTQLGGNSPSRRKLLSSGAPFRWDVSRRIKAHVLNPNLIPQGKFPAELPLLFKDEPQQDLWVVDFPTSPIIGNDDAEFDDEDDNPYVASKDQYLKHAVGEITSFDGPSFTMQDVSGAEGYTLEEDDFFQEFSRLQINQTWYVISDPIPWKFIFKFKFTNGHWMNNGSTTGAGN